MKTGPHRSACLTWACSWSRSTAQVNRVLAQDHVAQGHGMKADPVRPPGGKPAVKLECSAVTLDLSPGRQRQSPAASPTSVVGCPGVAGKSRKAAARAGRLGDFLVILMIHLCQCGKLLLHDRSR